MSLLDEAVEAMLNEYGPMDCPRWATLAHRAVDCDACARLAVQAVARVLLRVPTEAMKDVPIATGWGYLGRCLAALRDELQLDDPEPHQETRTPETVSK